MQYGALRDPLRDALRTFAASAPAGIMGSPNKSKFSSSRDGSVSVKKSETSVSIRALSAFSLPTVVFMLSAACFPAMVATGRKNWERGFSPDMPHCVDEPGDIVLRGAGVSLFELTRSELRDSVDAEILRDASVGRETNGARVTGTLLARYAGVAPP